MRSWCRMLAARLASDEGGFTLVELLNTTLLISILAAIAVPVYFSSRDRAYRTSAQGNEKELVLAAQLYWQVNYPASPRDPDASTSTSDSGFLGMTINSLKTVDVSLSSNDYVNNSGTEASGVTARAPLDASHFCVYSVSGRWFAYQIDTTGALTTTSDPTSVCT